MIQQRGRVFFRGARVLTMDPAPDAAGPLGRVIPSGDVLVEDGVIVSVRARSADETMMPPPSATTLVEAHGRVLMPAFIDAHTHACWAGDRLDEWQMKRRGVAYLDILRAGGGIMSTVRAVRAATQRQLTDALLARLHTMLREGTTTIEVKSGYGLSTEHELKMLRAIADAASSFPGTLVPTALLGHALDPDVPVESFISSTIRDTLPAVHAEFPGIAIDAFCEQGAWSLAPCQQLFEAAMSLGHPVRVHTDQFNALGMTDWAIANGARSVDHLEASTQATLDTLAASRTFAVVLPLTGLHLSLGATASPSAAPFFADAGRLVRAGGAERLVIATNCNPGSAPGSSMPLAMAIASRACGLEPAHAITAGTRNAAGVLGFADRGAIRAGARADLVLLKHTDERQLCYELGGNPVEFVAVAG